MAGSNKSPIEGHLLPYGRPDWTWRELPLSLCPAEQQVICVVVEYEESSRHTERGDYLFFSTINTDCTVSAGDICNCRPLDGDCFFEHL
jgi:hypothetical protein